MGLYSGTDQAEDQTYHNVNLLKQSLMENNKANRRRDLSKSRRGA